MTPNTSTTNLDKSSGHYTSMSQSNEEFNHSTDGRSCSSNHSATAAIESMPIIKNITCFNDSLYENKIYIQVKHPRYTNEKKEEENIIKSICFNIIIWIVVAMSIILNFL